MNSPIRVAVVDPYPLYRQGVVQTLARSVDFVLATEGESVADARRAVRQGGIGRASCRERVLTDV